MRSAVDPFYAVVRVIARFWIWFFFERVEVRHPERVPCMGPVLLCINHPNNLIDSLLIGSVLSRKAHDPDKLDRNTEMFAACDEAFEGERLIAIYPEGTIRADVHVQRIKTGAARIALSFEARERFRGRVLVSFGEPVAVSSYLAVYREEPAKALHSLTTAIQGAMEREVVHVARIDAAALARAVEELYRGDLERELWEERGLSGRRIDPVSRSIADAVEHFRKQDPERIERLWQRMLGYHAGLAAYRLGDEAVRTRLERTADRRRVARSWQTIVSGSRRGCRAGRRTTRR